MLSIHGNTSEIREWKDTVNIRANGTTSIAVRFDDRPGTWMMHCHILDHAELGMMTTLAVEEPGSSSGGHTSTH